MFVRKKLNSSGSTSVQVIQKVKGEYKGLKTVDYLYRYQGKSLNIDTVYRFLDKLNNRLKPQVEQIAFAHTKKVLNGNVSVVFYDMTTLYFEASEEDDLRKTGFSNDGYNRKRGLKKLENKVNKDRLTKAIINNRATTNT